METLSVGMYVRKKNGRIGRIKEIDERDNVQLWYLLDIKNSNFDVKCEGKHIKKASYNIKELLQVGDFVDYEYPTGLGMWYCKNVEITEHLLNVFKNGENNHEYKIT